MWAVEYLAAVRFFAPAAASARAIAQPAVAKRLKAPESIAQIEFVHIVAADAQATGIHVHTQAQVKHILLCSLRLTGKTGRKGEVIGVFGPGEGRSGIVQSTQGKLVEKNDVHPPGKQGKTFAKIQWISALRFEAHIGREGNFTSNALQKLERNDGAGMKCNARGHFDTGLQEGFIWTLAEQTGSVVDRQAYVRAQTVHFAAPAFNFTVPAPHQTERKIVKSHLFGTCRDRRAINIAKNGIQLIRKGKAAPIESALVVGIF